MLTHVTPQHPAQHVPNQVFRAMPEAAAAQQATAVMQYEACMTCHTARAAPLSTAGPGGMAERGGWLGCE
eukprot:5718926-Prymnesium_polylepis.1